MERTESRKAAKALEHIPEWQRDDFWSTGFTFGGCLSSLYTEIKYDYDRN
jgi:dienelactone hydrolase